MAMLEVADIHTYYGNIHALNGVSLTESKHVARLASELRIQAWSCGTSDFWN